MIAAGAVLGTGLLLTGCGLQNIGTPTKEETKSYDLDGKVAVLRVQSGSGAIVVNGSDRPGLHVTETLHWKADKPATRHPISGDVLTLDYKCSGGDWGCGVDYEVEVPRGMRVKLDTGSGDITLRTLSGEVDAKTGSGTIDANGLVEARRRSRRPVPATSSCASPASPTTSTSGPGRVRASCACRRAPTTSPRTRGRGSGRWRSPATTPPREGSTCGPARATSRCSRSEAGRPGPDNKVNPDGRRGTIGGKT